MEVNISNLNRFTAFYGEFSIYTDLQGKSGIINRQGEIVLQAGEFEIGTHVEGTKFAFQNTDDSRKELLFDAATGEKIYSVRPTTGHLPLENEYLVAPNRIAFQEDGLFGIKDEKGNIIVHAQYTQMSSLGENIGFIHVKTKENLSGIITANGKPFIKCKYAYIIHKRDTDTYKVKTPKGKFGLLNSNGKVLIPAHYDYLDVTNNLDEIAVKRGGKCFFINRNNKPIALIEAWENHLIEQFSSKSVYRLTKLGTPTSDGYVLAFNHFSDRVVIMQGECVLHETRLKENWIEYPKGTFFRPLQWIAPDRLQFFEDGYWGAMNPEGIVTIPPVFKFIVPFQTTGYFIVKDRHDKCGCVDKDFKMLYPCQYEYKELRSKLTEDFQNNA